MERSTLVTGANGFIGRHLVAELLKSGYRVTALVRSTQSAGFEPHDNLLVKTGDILDIRAIATALVDCDSVFHLASLVSIWHRTPNSFEEINVKGTEVLLNACRDSGVGRVLICSSCGVFGPSINGEPIDETKSIDQRFWGPYERSKYRQVEMALNYRSPQLEIVATYPTRVFGPNPSTDTTSLTAILNRIAKGKPWFVPGAGNAIGNYVYVGDVARGMRLVMEQGRNGEGYILGGSNVTYKQLIHQLEAITGNSAKVWHVPIWLLKVAAYVEELKSKILRVRPKITRQVIKKYAAEWPVSILKAHHELGYRPIDLGSSIRLTFDE